MALRIAAVLLLNLLCLQTVFGQNKSVMEIDEFRRHFQIFELDLWISLENQTTRHKKTRTEVRLIKRISKVCDVMEETFPNITYGLEGFEGVWTWAIAHGNIQIIQAFYQAFRKFQEKQIKARVPAPHQEWLDLAETILLDGKASMANANDRLEDIIDEEGLFENIHSAVLTKFCDLKQSPQQVLLNLYNAMAVAELKSYLMSQFSFMLLTLYNKGNFTKTAGRIRHCHYERSAKTLEKFKKVVDMASDEYWRCDPSHYRREVTYTAITKLVQGYVQNEVDLNDGNSCLQECPTYQETSSYGCYQNIYCGGGRCAGDVSSCAYLAADAWICPAKPTTGRRYEYIEFQNGQTLGRKERCTGGTTKVSGWMSWIFYRCSYCMCLCYDTESLYSDRYFNLRPSRSNIQHNRVVTGLRFIKKHRIIHLQIQEGQMLAMGKIDQGTLVWVPVNEYKISDKGVRNGEDYHTLSRYKRHIGLDDLIGDTNEVVTGCRFKIIGPVLTFAIRLTPFDYDCGALNTSASYWKHYEEYRSYLNLNNLDVPTRSVEYSQPNLKKNLYTTFTSTNLYKDAAQTTVPFIDIQPVESSIAMPLSGAGIYHKGSSGYGGFVAPKIITFNIHELIQNALDDPFLIDTQRMCLRVTAAVLLNLLYLQTVFGLNETLLQVDELIRSFRNYERKLWVQVDRKVAARPRAISDVQLIKKFQKFCDRIQQAFPNKITYGLDGLEGAWIWDRAYSEMQIVEAFYDAFRKFQAKQIKAQGPSPQQDWVDTAETMLVDGRYSLKDAVARLEDIIEYYKLFQHISLAARRRICILQQSPHQVLLKVYNVVALSELKSYSMSLFSYMLLRVYNKGNFTQEATLLRDCHNERSANTLENFKNAIASASRDLWICDPTTHKYDVTYTAVTKLIQGYIQNKMDLNENRTCFKQCKSYKNTSSYGCYQGNYCGGELCYGDIVACRHFTWDAWICPAKPSSGRRYEYIEFPNGRTLGRKTNCPLGTTIMSGFSTSIIGYCSYCLCLCFDYEGRYSDRYFSLRSSEANMDLNRVVTGIRFIKKNRIIHLQVQEGQLMRKGNVDASTVNWVPVEDYKIWQRGVRNGQDYHTLTREKRYIGLDNLTGRRNEIVTGCRIVLSWYYLILEIRLTKFDFDSGRLNTTASRWKRSENYRDHLGSEKINKPTRTPTRSWPDSENSQYIRFTSTDFDLDAAQTTVPYIDIQPVEAQIPVPAAGVGIYHKGTPGYGGFIAPKLITHNYDKLVQNAIDQPYWQII